MQYFKALLVSALAAVASAQLEFTSFPPASLVAGAGSYSLTYKTAEGMINTPVTIELKEGPSSNLKTIPGQTKTATGGVFVFKPASGLVTGSDYALSISQGSAINYTPQFSIKGSAMSSSSSSMSFSATTMKTSASMPSYPGASGNSSMGYAPSTATGGSAPMGTGAMGTGSGSGMRNGTFSSATLTATATSSVLTGSATASATTAASTGAAPRVDSSIALVLGAFAAFAYLN